MFLVHAGSQGVMEIASRRSPALSINALGNVYHYPTAGGRLVVRPPERQRMMISTTLVTAKYFAAVRRRRRLTGGHIEHTCRR
jgi:hypothetical protein